jgi:hypothetical protein
MVAYVQSGFGTFFASDPLYISLQNVEYTKGLLLILFLVIVIYQIKN